MSNVGSYFSVNGSQLSQLYFVLVKISDNLADCCMKYMSYNYYDCLASDPSYISPVASLFYPDWEGSNTGCVADGNAPGYMVLNPSEYMYENLSDCCQERYPWSLDCYPSSTSTLWCFGSFNKCIQFTKCMFVSCQRAS